MSAVDATGALAVAPRDLHPLLAHRDSPRAFDPAHEIDAAQLGRLLDAARWAPSSRNSQPWRFVAGRRGDAVFAALAEALVPGNRSWAQRAGALVLALVRRAGTGGEALTHAEYDVGQAVAHLTVQAEADGLGVRQMAGFTAERLTARLFLPGSLAPLTVLAVGRRAEPVRRARERLPADVVVLGVRPPPPRPR